MLVCLLGGRYVIALHCTEHVMMVGFIVPLVLLFMERMDDAVFDIDDMRSF